MSGLEIAGVALGVLPILVEVVKSYSTVSKKLRTLRHCSREVKSIWERLKVHKGIFMNEVRLLLQLIEDEADVERMLEDTGDPRWTSQQLNEKLSAVLKTSFEICCGIVEDTKGIVDSMQNELKKFDVLLDQKSKGESIKSTIKRLGGAIKITFDKSRHEKCLSSLRERNGDLCALRSQIGAFQQYEIRTTSTRIVTKPLPTTLSSIQNASQKLHEALCGAWCCDDVAHRGHYAKLCVDAEVHSDVRLDLAISCHDAASSVDNLLSQKPPIWLYVQSMSTSEGEPGKQTIQHSPTAPLPTLPLEILKSCAMNVLKKKASFDLQSDSSCRKKAKLVHFISASEGLERAPAVSAVAVQTLPAEINLCQTKNICNYLQQHYQTSRAASVNRCIGYLESPQMYKHLFYFRDRDRATNPGQPQAQIANVYSIFDIMQRDPDDALEVKDQLRLAHKTAQAMLQFNDTPWLCERWRLRDMSYFGSQSSFDDEALKTLHLSSQISSPTATTTINNTMDGIERVEDVVSDQVRYGINNTTLFFLGVALLEIAHWKPIEEKMTARDLNNEVFAARRLAAGRAPLGPQYQKIAEKCLQCNFGVGTELSNKRLQTAVYNDVVCELEDMIEKLTI